MRSQLLDSLGSRGALRSPVGPTTGGADMSETTSLITKAVVVPFETCTPNLLAFSLDTGALVCNRFLE